MKRSLIVFGLLFSLAFFPAPEIAETHLADGESEGESSRRGPSEDLSFSASGRAPLRARLHRAAIPLRLRAAFLVAAAASPGQPRSASLFPFRAKHGIYREIKVLRI